ncbi:Zn-dependent exopeptidase [Pelomyxa schiedti]|nr:Zn-dependent exopeptidase [Pelomyxa schiedti]
MHPTYDEKRPGAGGVELDSLLRNKTPADNGAETKKQKRRRIIVAVISSTVVVLSVLTVILIILFFTIPVQLTERINVSNIEASLDTLQSIAEIYGNARDDFSGGYMASLEHVWSRLTKYQDKLEIWEQKFFYTCYQVIQCNVTLVEPDSLEFVYGEDFLAMTWSSSGLIERASIHSVSSFGCEDMDYQQMSSGSIAIIPSGGNCSWNEKIGFAWRHNASAVIGYNTEDQSGPLRVTLDSSSISAIPAVGVPYSTGVLLSASGPTSKLHLQLDSGNYLVGTSNLMAQTKSGDDHNMIIAGAHLDSYRNPGINDNGSGSMTLLEIATAVAESRTGRWLENKILFAWWAAEEFGLKGSSAYLDSLNETQRDSIACNINLDMLASPNFIIGVMNGSTAFSTSEVKCGSSKIEEYYVDYFKANLIPYEIEPMHNQSDFVPFIMAGIPANGAQAGFTTKTVAQRLIFGGIPNALADTCVHQSCDTKDNISPQSLGYLARANAYVIQRLAEKKNLKQYLACD